ncbi:hypothetical protein GOODEAATRI_020776, partial [Goodea atripinnis]
KVGLSNTLKKDDLAETRRSGTLPTDVRPSYNSFIMWTTTQNTFFSAACYIDWLRSANGLLPTATTRVAAFLYSTYTRAPRTRSLSLKKLHSVCGTK